MKKFKKIDVGIIINIYLIAFLSIVFVYSAKMSGTNEKELAVFGMTFQFTEAQFFMMKEILWITLGSILMIVFSMIDYKVYSKYSKLIYIFCIILLVLVFVLGKESKGATRWIDLGFISFQPSELAKLFIVLTFSELLVNGFKDGIRGWGGVLKAGGHFIIPFLLIFKQPDLATSLVFVALFYIMIFLHGVDLLQYIMLVGSNILMAPIGYLFMKDYQRDRIKVFLDPESHKMGDGWNIIQSIIAVGSGGIMGKGIFNGSQNKLKFLPESHTDFIFSVLAEEAGLLGALFLISLYIWLIMQILSLSKKTDDSYGKTVAFGLAAVVFFHTVINMGMVIGIFPVAGIPLLLMSYGGTSFMFVFIIMGILQSIKIHNTL